MAYIHKEGTPRCIRCGEQGLWHLHPEDKEEMGSSYYCEKHIVLGALSRVLQILRKLERVLDFNLPSPPEGDDG